MRRRRFIEGLAAGLPAFTFLAGAASAAGPGRRHAFEPLREELGTIRDEAAFWGRVRQEFALNPGLIHLNTGTLGAVPRKVLDAVAAWMYEIEGDPASNVFGAIGHRMEEVRAQAAGFLGAQLDEIALVENTTSGMNAVAEGLARNLKSGDEILTTSHEHPGGTVCWEYLVRHQGAKIVQIPMPAPVEGKDQILQLVSDHITPRTRVCSFSHVETITGLRMPLAEISAITRPKEILLVCDGAQAPGMLKVDVKGLGVDAYASSSHKWMLAPKGCGLLYIRKEAQAKIQPLALSTGYHAYTAASGTRNVAQILGHGLTMDFHDTIGRERVEARCKGLAAFLRRRFSEISGLRPITPAQDDLVGGIVSFALTRGKNAEIYDRLHKEHNIAVKVVPKAEYNALRFSTHVFNREEDIDRTAEILATMLRG